MKRNAIAITIAAAALTMGHVAVADQVINDDLIVTFSECIGNDCVNGESFGFDTLRLKENNTRIKFQDTSNSGSFPSNDWQLTANDSTNGGANKFSIDDVDGGKTPFTIEAGTPSNTLYVDSTGRVGFGTSTPVVDLHDVNGNTPTLRLEQNGSSGFTPQTWDVAGNEANFFVRDVTNGSKLPFRIQPGAPTSSLFIAADGDIGLGTESPATQLHISEATADTNVKMALENSTDATSWEFVHRAASDEGFAINNPDNTGAEFILSQTGDLTVQGGIVSGTDGICTSTTPCDAVFSSQFDVESIEEHAQFMWQNSYLRGVGPTPEGAPTINLTQKTAGILNELEKAHIYIDHLNSDLSQKDQKIARLMEEQSELASKVARLEAITAELALK